MPIPNCQSYGDCVVLYGDSTVHSLWDRHCQSMGLMSVLMTVLMHPNSTTMASSSLTNQTYAGTIVWLCCPSLLSSWESKTSQQMITVHFKTFWLIFDWYGFVFIVKLLIYLSFSSIIAWSQDYSSMIKANYIKRYHSYQ